MISRRLMAAAVASAALVAAMVVAGVVVAAPAARAQSEPLEEMVFVVNAFKFPDALAAASVGGSAEAVLDEIATLGYDVRREVVADTIPGLDAETLQGLTPGELGGDAGDVGERLDDLEGRLDDVEAANVELQARVAELEGLLAGVTRGDVDARETLQLAGMNVQVLNGEGATDTTNGLGNLIVGYHEDLTCDPLDDGCADVSDNSPDERTGSHMLVTGIDHTYTEHRQRPAGVGVRRQEQHRQRLSRVGVRRQRQHRR